MKSRDRTSAIILMVILALSTSGQPVNPRSLVAQLALPAGNNTWVVQVFTSGGLIGTGDGDFGISSEGRLICSSLDLGCPKEVQAPQLQTVMEMVQAVVPFAAVVPTVSLCNDCIRRTIVIRRRDSLGIEFNYTASWDDLSRANVPREVLQIYDAVAALRK
jgi:hypothetical protein